MSTASKSPEAAPPPMREYKSHFEMWDEVIDDADAPPLRNGRRPWSPPVLTEKTYSLPHRKLPPRAEPVEPIPSIAIYAGAIAIGAFLSVLIMRPWEYSTAAKMATAKPAAKVAVTRKPVAKAAAATPPKTQVAAVPSAVPSVGTYAKQSITAPPKLSAPSKAVAKLARPAPMASLAAVAKPKAVASAAPPNAVAVAPAPAKPIAIASMGAAQPKASAAPKAVVVVPAPLNPAAIASIAAVKAKAVASPAPARVEAVASPPSQPAAIASMVAAQPKAVESAAPPKVVAVAPEPPKPAATSSPSQSVNVASAPMVPQPIKVAPPAAQESAEPVPPKPGNEAPAEESAVGVRENSELAPLHRMLLESAIRTQLAGVGFPDLGVSVNGDGDVYLNGTFQNVADQDKVIAMIREHRGVRDIYFSGTLWHQDQAPTPIASAPAPNQQNSQTNSAPPQQVAKLPPNASQGGPGVSPSAPSRHVKIAHSVDFPVTAAEVPAPKPIYAAPPPTIAPTPAMTPHGLFPFKWLNRLRG